MLLLKRWIRKLKQTKNYSCLFLFWKRIFLLLWKKEIFENEKLEKKRKKRKIIKKNIEEINSIDTENYFEITETILSPENFFRNREWK